MRLHGEGTVFQRKKTGKWVAAVSLPDGRRRTRYANDQRTALAYLEELRQGVTAPSPRISLSAYLDAWLMGIRAQVAPRTWSRWDGICRNWIRPGLGHYALRDLTPSIVRSWLFSLPLHPQTVSHVRATLRRALADAVADGIIQRNVAALAKTPPIPTEERGWLSGDQLRCLFIKTRRSRLRCLWVLAGTTGLRSAELLGLTWGDLDRTRRVLHVRHTLHREAGEWVLRPTKTRQERVVPLATVAIKALERHHRWYDRQAGFHGFVGRHGLVFVSPEGNPLHGPNLSRLLREDLRAAGLPVVTFHDIRHSVASWWLSLGVDWKTLAELLGHSDPRITMRLYAHVGDAMKRDAIDRMGV